MFKFSNRSKKRINQLHPDLQKVVIRALEITEVDFSVIEGARSVARQRKLVASGASTTMNSRHIPKGNPPVSHAVDIAPYINGKIEWNLLPPFYKLADAMKEAARELKVDLKWGGDWKTFKDRPHFQLTWKTYP